MKSLSLTVQKLWQRLKLTTDGQKGQRLKLTTDGQKGQKQYAPNHSIRAFRGHKKGQNVKS